MRDLKVAATATVMTLLVVFLFGVKIGTALVQLGGRFQNAATAVVVHAYDDTLPKVVKAQERR